MGVRSNGVDVKLDTSHTGLNRATARLNRNAHQTASHSMRPSESETDHVTLTVERITTELAFKANASVLRTEDEMKASIIDILA